MLPSKDSADVDAPQAVRTVLAAGERGGGGGVIRARVDTPKSRGYEYLSRNGG